MGEGITRRAFLAGIAAAPAAAKAAIVLPKPGEVCVEHVAVPGVKTLRLCRWTFPSERGRPVDPADLRPSYPGSIYYAGGYELWNIPRAYQFEADRIK